MILSIILIVSFFVFLRFVAKQADEMTDYLNEIKAPQDRDLFE